MERNKSKQYNQMKLFTYFTVIASLLLITFNSSAQKKNVLDYYHLLAISEVYKITTEDGKYVTYGENESVSEVTVDLNNGFVEFKDEGTEGRAKMIQISLFRRNNDDVFIAYTFREFEGMDISSNYDFFEENDGSLISCRRKYPLSELSLLNKVLKEFPEDLDRTIAVELITPIYELSKHGQTIYIDFFVNPFVSETQKRRLEVQKKLLKMDIRSAYWKYNKSKDQFEIVNP